MKINIARELIESRENAIGFLHMTDIATLNTLLNEDIDKLSYNAIATIVFKKYADKNISNAKFSKCISILLSNNTLFKIPRYRYDNSYNCIYEFENGSYYFIKKGGIKELQQLIKENGEYI